MRTDHHTKDKQNMIYVSELKISIRWIHSHFVKHRQIVVNSLEVSEFHKDLTKISLWRIAVWLIYCFSHSYYIFSLEKEITENSQERKDDIKIS